MAGRGGDISLPDVSKLNDLKDDQIEALIEKLAEVQAHAPQIIAALEEQKEARSRGSKSVGSKEGPPTQPQRSRNVVDDQYVEEIVEEEESDNDDETDEEEDDDEGDYPMVGEGYSDEISVVSDMTTPTVVSSMEVHEEEFYHDMMIGGRKVNAPKKRDLLSQVARTNASRQNQQQSAAAATQKAIPKVQTIQRPTSANKTNIGRSPKPKSPGPGMGPSPRKKSGGKATIRVAPGATTTTTSTTVEKSGGVPKKTSSTKKKVKKANSKSMSAAGFENWNNSFEKNNNNNKLNNSSNNINSNTGKSKSAHKKSSPIPSTQLKEEKKQTEPVMIDDDGFLVNQGDFSDAFDSNPFGDFTTSTMPSSTSGGSNSNNNNNNQTTSTKNNTSANNDVFGSFADFGNPTPTTPVTPTRQRKTTSSSSKPRKLNEVGKSKSTKSHGSADGSRRQRAKSPMPGSGVTSPKTKKKGSRRSSVV